MGLLVAAAFCWSTAGVLIKAVAWSPLAVAGARGGIAAVFLLLVSRGLRFHFSREQVIGALCYAACTVTFCTATKLTTAANAILLQYTAPVWIALFAAWILGERTTRGDWVTIVVVLVGMGLFFAEDLDVTALAGNAVGALAGVFFAAMTIALRKQKDTSALESIILGNAIAFGVGLPWIVRSPMLPAEGWAALVALGVVQLGVAYWLYARAIKVVTALEAVLIPVMEPILNPVWVLIAMDERPSGWALLGGAIVLGAATVRAVVAVSGRRVLQPKGA